VNCLISLKVTTDYDHMTSDAPNTFKISGSKEKGYSVTEQ